MNQPVLGIDLGQTRVTAAVVEDGSPKIIRTASGETGIPCIVAVNEAGSIVVGAAALEAARRHPERYVDDVRSLLGQRLADIPPTAAPVSADGDQFLVTLSSSGPKLRCTGRSPEPC